MSMAEYNRGNVGYRPSSVTKPTNSVADKKIRAAFAAKCAEHINEILAFKVATFRNETLPLSDRDRAADWIVNRALGRVPQPVEASGGTVDLVRHVYEVKWLPSEPADSAKVIEATADKSNRGLIPSG
jgi:hypothetical protein